VQRRPAAFRQVVGGPSGGEGSWVWDADGNRCLDATAGLWYAEALLHEQGRVERDRLLIDRLRKGL
jgi:adenosylmethionine-8-amino-7-oxononanoate aminotransferase